MGKMTPSLDAETEAVREAYAALNRNDIPAMIESFDPQIERIEFEGLPQEGAYRGLAAVKEHISKARATWAEGSCEPRQFIIAGDKIVASVDVRVRLKHETQWREGQVADVFTFRNGKIIQFRTFSEIQQALEWAGVDGLDSSQPTTDSKGG